MAAVAVNVVRRRQKCLKGKIYLKGRYSNMKKFLAFFMVVAVVMGMAFVVMSSADEKDATFTINVSDPVNGVYDVSVDISATTPISGFTLQVKLGDGVSFVEFADEDEYFGDIALSASKGYNNASLVYLTAERIVHVVLANSKGNVQYMVGNPNGSFGNKLTGAIKFQIKSDRALTANDITFGSETKLVSDDKDKTNVTFDFVPVLPAAPTTTTETPVPTTTEAPVPTTTEAPVPTTTETPVPTTTEVPVPTTTEDPDAPTTTGEEPAPTTTAKDPNTSDGSAMGMFAFIALAIASLACAVVVIVRRKRA